MSRHKKTLIQKTVAAPLIIGAVTAVLFFIMLPVVSWFFPLSDENLEIADFEQPWQETAIDYSKVKADGVVKKSETAGFERNTLIGSVEIGSAQIPIVYDADNVSLSGAVSVLPDGDYIGETGTAYVYGIKSVVDTNAFHTGQDINVKTIYGIYVNIKTIYGIYVFTVTDIRTVPYKHVLFSMNTNVKRGLVLYTNSDSGYGISSSLRAVVMEMKSGPAVEE